MVKTKEQYINDVLMDLFFLTKKKGKKINKKKNRINSSVL